MVEKVYFALREARNILPKLKPLLRKLILSNVQITVQNDLSIQYEDPDDDMCQLVKESKRWHRTNLRYFNLIEKLLKIGVVVEDPALGMIDFYSKHRGREILLCYRYHELTINYWHEIDDVFEQRKSIKQLRRD